MKKIGIRLFILIILLGSVFFYLKHDLEQDVIDYLIEEKNVDKGDIIVSDSFISNLPGSKNYMVSIKLKNDNRTYRYYRKDGQIILESYTENGREHVLP